MQHARNLNQDSDAWKRSRVSACGTHHIADGRLLYTSRFLRVLPFHSPGLAPVRDSEGAFHIYPDGSPAYANRHLDAFGFYEGLAAVRDNDGWFHIRPDGTPAYATRYAWCGNFQGGRCAARVIGGGYRHILPDGCPLYHCTYRYVGDFREGRAVARREDGQCVHLDETGGLAHSHAYLDLDVYHKGFARARDKRGWMHIGMGGIPAYERRFVAVEPFYNGQSLAETFDGEIIVVDENSETTAEIARSLADDFAVLSSDMTGFWRTFSLAAAVELGAIEILPCSEDEAAKQLGLPKENARILLCALSEMHIVFLRDGRWQLTHKGEHLRRAHPDSLADAALEWVNLSKTQWGNFPAVLRSEGIADGYFSHLAHDPAAARVAHNMLAAYARRDYHRLPELLPLDGIRRLIDAGGGSGETARMIAARHPELEIILLERQEAIASMASALRKDENIAAQAGDIFLSWNVRADAVLLARVLHDWDDERALQILRNARAALPTGGKLFIVEMLRRGLADGALCSLHLRVVSGGRERNWEDFQQLGNTAGFRLLESRSLDAIPSLIIGEAI